VVNGVTCARDPRSEVYNTVAQTGGNIGEEHWYGWYLALPSSDSGRFWSNGNAWNLLIQFYEPVIQRANINIGVDATASTTSPRLYFGTRSSHTVIADPVRYDHWYHYVLHAKWSPDPAVGFVQLYQDGQEVFPLTHMATMSTDTHGINIAQDYYGPDQTGGLGVSAYEDQLCRADSFAAASAC
jgi:hypothetical protein